jgi:hypothetical protein
MTVISMHMQRPLNSRGFHLTTVYVTSEKVSVTWWNLCLASVFKIRVMALLLRLLPRLACTDQTHLLESFH